MTDMLVLGFDTLDGAHNARNKLVELNNEFLLKLDQAVEVARNPDGKLKIQEERSLAGAGAIGGAFWGLLLGLIFLVPAFGMAVGAASGAIAGHFAKFGMTKEYMNQINETIKPGQSGLFILADNVKLDRVTPMLASFHPRVLRTSLSMDQEKALREAFGSAAG
jgi:uncharacterized membrane protein